MKTLCFDARLILSAGVGRYIQNLAFRMGKAPFRVILIATAEGVKEFPWLERHEIIFNHAAMNSIEEQIQIPRLVPKCDLFWSPNFNMPHLPMRAAQQIVTIQDASYFSPHTQLKWHQRLLSHAILKRVTRKADHIFTISQFSKDELIKYTDVAPEKISPIYLGIDHQQFSNITETPPNETTPFFFYVGNTKPHKNLKRLVQAFELLLKEGYKYRLLFAGKKEGFRVNSDVEAYVAQTPLLRNHVSFLGAIDDATLLGLYTHAQALVYPSLYEGFGFPPVEAMRFGCPAIVARAGSIPEVCGEAAYYVDPLNIEDIAAGLKKVATDQALRQKLKSAGQTHAKRFTWDKCAEEHFEVINRPELNVNAKSCKWIL